MTRIREFPVRCARAASPPPGHTGLLGSGRADRPCPAGRAAGERIFCHLAGVIAGRWRDRLLPAAATLTAVALAVDLTAAAPDRPLQPQGRVGYGERILIDYLLTNQTPR